MLNNQPGPGWADGSMFCSIGLLGGGGATHTPFTHGPSSWALLGGMVAAMAVATVWLMRRWSRPAASGKARPAAGMAGRGKPADARTHTPELDPQLAEELTRIEAHEADEPGEPALR